MRKVRWKRETRGGTLALALALAMASGQTEWQAGRLAGWQGTEPCTVVSPTCPPAHLHSYRT